MTEVLYTALAGRRVVVKVTVFAVSVKVVPPELELPPPPEPALAEILAAACVVVLLFPVLGGIGITRIFGGLHLAYGIYLFFTEQKKTTA